MYMRSEQEMFDLILNYAKTDGRVCAVLMNGSRANPNAPRDMFQDFDIVYVVTDYDSFVSDHTWIDYFGERLMVQMPEDMPGAEGDGHFTYLMLFRDMNRIDLTLIPLERSGQLIEYDSEEIVLLDKNGLYINHHVNDDSMYHIEKPAQKDFDDCCNEFWWVLQNAVKGIWRDELPYAIVMLGYGREMLEFMLGWHIGLKYDFAVSAGKFCKYFKRYLESDLYEKYISSFPSGTCGEIWNSLFEMCRLFKEICRKNAEELGFSIILEYEENMMDYYCKVFELCGENNLV